MIDKSGYFTEAALAKLNQDDTLNKLTLVNVPGDILRDRYDSLGYNGYVVIPATLDWRKGLDSLSFNTNKTYGIGATVPVERKLNRLWDEIRNDSLGIDAGKKTILATSKINLKMLNIKKGAADSQSATIIGYVCGFLMYLILLLYGSQVMMALPKKNEPHRRSGGVVR